jgi:hypothetical protein
MQAAENTSTTETNYAELRKKAEYTLRLTLYYHVCRVQLEGGRDNLDPESSRLMRREAMRARVAGFRKMAELHQAGVRVRDCDDQALRIEATKLAYELRRGDLERAMERERYVVEAMVSETLGEITFTPQATHPDSSLAVAA